MEFAPRISLQVREEIERLADQPMSAAEITRSAGDFAERLGQRRPSYEQVRTIVRRVRRSPKRLSTTDVLLDIAFRVKPPDALMRLDPPRRRRH